MRLLAWDTSSKEGVLAALEWDPEARSHGWNGVKLVAEWSLSIELTHSERLLWGIHQILESARWKLQEVDVFAVGVGPGSFTSLRVGITTARTLAHSMKKPLIGVSSLAALARPAALWLHSQKSKALLIATTDAAKGELFALYGSASSIVDCVVLSEGDMQGLWKRGVEEKVLSPSDLVTTIQQKVLKSRASSWLAIGEGRNRYPDEWKKLSVKSELQPPVPFMNQVQGRYVGMLAWEAFQAGLLREPLHVHPRYVRAPDAELKLKAGLLPPAGAG
jgi:tRNA threonylcarbamoyladenosine biosynthesis protein TsaB